MRTNRDKKIHFFMAFLPQNLFIQASEIDDEKNIFGSKKLSYKSFSVATDLTKQ